MPERSPRFGEAELALLRQQRQVRIHTSAGPGAAVHRTVIWVVVDDQQRVLVRSWRGETARWYREAVAHPQARLEVGDMLLAVRVERAADEGRIEACSTGFRHKYAGDPDVPAMVADAVLETTLELTPG